MKILVLGDFSGNSGNRKPLASRPRTRIDYENFDNVLAALSPTVSLPLPGDSGPAAEIQISEFDDFHPDALFRKLAAFRAMHDLRRRLQNPDTFLQAAAQLNATGGDNPTPDAPDDGATEGDDATLERLMGRPRREGPASGSLSGPQQDHIASFLRGTVGPHLSSGPDPRQPELIDSVDRAISEQMRIALHHPAFRALEEIWLSLHQLVFGLDSGEAVEIRILDVTKDELSEDFEASKDDIRDSSLYRSVVETDVEMQGQEPWSLLVCNFSFGPTPRELLLLASLGTLASHAGGPLLAEADSTILEPTDGDPKSRDRWRALRLSQVAPWIGLALPRVLLRVPYGKGGEEVDGFAFEEVRAGEERDSALWGNPAFLIARSMGETFQEDEWSGGRALNLEVADLPSYAYVEDGESRLLPCGATPLTKRAAEQLLESGLIPILSYTDRNALRILQLQSVAEPPQALRGPWSG